MKPGCRYARTVGLHCHLGSAPWVLCNCPAAVSSSRPLSCLRSRGSQAGNERAREGEQGRRPRSRGLRPSCRNHSAHRCRSPLVYLSLLHEAGRALTMRPIEFRIKPGARRSVLVKLSASFNSSSVAPATLIRRPSCNSTVSGQSVMPLLEEQRKKLRCPAFSVNGLERTPHAV